MMQHTIRIDNLGPDIYVAELCSVFKKYGNILSARVEFGKIQSSLHTGYISFDSPSSAEFAVKDMVGKKVLGKPIIVEIDSSGGSDILKNQFYTKIFVKNFDTNWDECDLVRVFEKFGEVKDADVSESYGKSNGYGFVKFAKQSSANAAVQAMHGQLVTDKKLIVEPFLHKEFRSISKPTLVDAKELLEKSTQLNNLHVKNLPKDMTDEELRELFEPYGKIESVKIARDDYRQSKGFGFVCFSNAKDAGKARERMNKCSYNSKILEVNFNQRKEFRKQYLHLINTDEKVRRFKKEEELKPFDTNKNTVFSFSTKNK